MIPAQWGGSSLNPSPGGSSSQDEGMQGSHVHHKSSLELGGRSLLSIAGVPTLSVD